MVALYGLPPCSKLCAAAASMRKTSKSPTPQCHGSVAAATAAAATSATPLRNRHVSAITTPMTTAAAQTISSPPKRSALKANASAQLAVGATHVACDGSAATIDRAAMSSADAIASSNSAAGLLDPALIMSASTTATVASNVASPEPTETRVAGRVPKRISAQRVVSGVVARGTRLG